MRLKHIDMLRGIAALLVFMAHIHGHPVFGWYENAIADFVLHLGVYGVDVFFVISGFIIPYSLKQRNFNYSQFRSFFTRRFVRIELPYLASILLVISLLYLSAYSSMFKGNLSGMINPLNLLHHLTYTNEFFRTEYYNVVYWTLAVEFHYYLFVSIFFIFINHPSKIVFIIFIITINVLAYYLHPDLHIRALPRYLPLFSFGFILYRVFSVDTNNLLLYIILILFVAILNTFINGIVSSLFGIFGFLWIFYKNMPLKRILLFTGKISFSLYLVHVPISSRCLNLSSRFVSHNSINATVLIMLSVIVTITFAYLFYRFIESPCTRLSRRF